MRDKILKLYFPALVPRYRHAQRWRCLAGYDAASVIPGGGVIQVVRHCIKAWHDSAVGKRILFFSDLHYAPESESLGDELCSIVRSLKADLLLCGGDLCSDAINIKLLPSILEKLSGCAPQCAAIPGNWERGKNWLPQKFWKELFRKYDWNYLCNDAITIGDWGWIYGCDDISRGYPAVTQQPPEEREKIFLVHRPDTVIAVDREYPLNDFSLILCGHTHGGQIRIPLFGAITAPSFYGRHLTCGVYGKDNIKTRMIVSTGVNHASFPWRINCRREVLLVELC